MDVLLANVLHVPNKTASEKSTEEQTKVIQQEVCSLGIKGYKYIQGYKYYVESVNHLSVGLVISSSAFMHLT